nr:MAG TPA: hydrogenase/urease nickel incorporation protein [Caudoviricetes sp.]
MERYTENHYDGNGYYLICSGNCEMINCEGCDILGEIVDRLAAYEDTGLEPEDFKRSFDEGALLKLTGQFLGVTPDRLRELAQADREGRVTIWEKTYQCPKCGYRLTPRLDNQFYFCFHCRTQFTQEEAEKALEEQNDRNY